MPTIIRTILIAALAGLLPATAFSTHTKSDFSAIMAELEANRKLIVTENMRLPEDPEAFWLVYTAYRAEIADLEVKGLRLLQEFRDHFENMTDQRANAVMSEYFELEQRKLVIRKANIKTFNSVLSAKKTLRFYQIENKLDTIIQADISAVTPLVD